jgi:aminopeptidase N
LFDGISYGKGSAFVMQVHNVIGHDTLKEGLHDYFATYAWKNTTLPDFVGCLHKAFEKSGNKSMGEDFNFTEWCDTWLKTSGINILEPVVEYNDDSSVK